MAGHNCSECGATIAQCDDFIKEHGRGCCGSCFMRDTHGLLDVADQQQDVENLHRLVAQMVIARGEHANAIRALQAEVSRLFEVVARVEERLAREEQGERKRLLAEVMTEVRAAVRDLPERVQELEDVAVGLERHLRIVRKPKGMRAQ